MKRATHIRDAGPTDAAAIARIHCRSWRETYRGLLPDATIDGMDEAEMAKRWAGRLSGGRTFAHLAETDTGAAVGFGAGTQLETPECGCDGLLDCLYVLRDFHGTGLGRRLMWRTAEGLSARGLAGMVVVVLATNPARDFYRAMGGEEVVERHREFRGADVHEVLLTWPLPLAEPST